MEPQSLLGTLESAAVVETSQAAVRLTESFTEAVTDRRSSLAGLDGAEIESLVETEITDRSPLLESVSDADPSFIARCLELTTRTSGLRGAEIVRTAVVLDSAEPIPSEGAPARFLPIRGDRIEVAVALGQYAIVYIWREDCPPCDAMREELESQFTEQPEDIALYAVYGPDWSELLSDRYDVGGGPTTLFFTDSAVDRRLVGAQYGTTIRRELEQYR